MDKETREGLIKFCILAMADLSGVDFQDIEADEFLNMTDEELEKEANWLDDMLGK